MRVPEISLGIFFSIQYGIHNYFYACTLPIKILKVCHQILNSGLLMSSEVSFQRHFICCILSWFFLSPWSFVNTCKESPTFSYFLSFLATEVVTVFVFQEPSLLSSLQDNGLTDVMLHALLIKDVSPFLFLCEDCSVHTPSHRGWYRDYTLLSLCSTLVKISWHLHLNYFRCLQTHFIFSLGSCYPWSPWLPPKCI